MRSLVFGPMPLRATPESHLAAGPWCFAGQEENFPGWDGDPGKQGRFPLPPDPYPTGDDVATAARSANAEVVRLARYFGEQGNKIHGRSLSDAFWLTFLGPHLLLCTHMLLERQQRVLDLIALYGAMPLRVDILPPDIPFSFADSRDFMLRGVQDTRFNHYIYSRMLESLAPAAWQLIVLPAQAPRTAAPRHKTPARARWRERLGRLLRDLPFPRYKGFSLWQSCLLSLAVLSNGRKRDERGLDFSAYCGEPPVWRFAAEEMIAKCLPLDILAAKLPQKIRPLSVGCLRGMTPALSQDNRYCLRLATLRERGCRLFAVQHGANYGNLASVGIQPFEYAADAFFSWGWRRHEGWPANAKALPHPALAAIADSHREKAPRLILVGTEMSAFAYRLKSRPQAGGLPAYRAGKVAFLQAVRAGLGLDAEILYRPYFPVAGGLDDERYVVRRLPGTRICTGDLTVQMLGCRLLVLDHYGTTLLMALAANVPILAYWRRDDWPMTPESEKALDSLRHAGILFDTPWEAARKAIALWPDAGSWRRDEKVQKARRLWLEGYARVGASPDCPWRPMTLTRHWCSALRGV